MQVSRASHRAVEKSVCVPAETVTETGVNSLARPCRQLIPCVPASLLSARRVGEWARAGRSVTSNGGQPWVSKLNLKLSLAERLSSRHISGDMSPGILGVAGEEEAGAGSPLEGSLIAWCHLDVLSISI